ncbi:MAG: hypothetical protein D6744_08815 [Planctomycetota bacterium]|nr:MAG: hypothetical protein D6744_08815 [Planctomycetota bacterium]
MAICVLGGGWLAARYGRRGARTSMWAGALCGVLNLLILGAVLKSLSSENFVRYAAIWAPTSIIATAIVALIGGLLAGRGAATGAAVNWRCAFACVAAGATLLLLSAGGAVTGAEAGLAVPDWPSSFGYNMFLYPLAKMTGGVYFEHAHRLLGSLVGLTTVLLALYVWWTDPRGWVRGFAWVCVGAVIVQGVLGGFRVSELSLTLAMVHGALGQVFFCALVTMAVLTSRAWQSSVTVLPTATVERDRTIGVVAFAAMFLQLIFGVLLRHAGDSLTWALHLHLTFAVVAAGCAGLYLLRVWGRGTSASPARRAAGVAGCVLILQLLLGFAALAGVLIDTGQPHWAQILATTLHQTVGAVLLASIAATNVLCWRLIRPSHSRAFAASPAAARFD